MSSSVTAHTLQLRCSDVLLIRQRSLHHFLRSLLCALCCVLSSAALLIFSFNPALSSSLQYLPYRLFGGIKHLLLGVNENAVRFFCSLPSCDATLCPGPPRHHTCSSESWACCSGFLPLPTVCQRPTARHQQSGLHRPFFKWFRLREGDFTPKLITTPSGIVHHLVWL